MPELRFLGSFFTLLALTAGVAGCSNSARARVVPDKIEPHAAQKAMELYDANHDGFLDAKELEKAPGLKAGFASLLSQQGKISEQDIADRIKSWEASGVGRTGVHCRVLHNGKPLAGATIHFVPESFLGGSLLPGKGVATAQGFAIISSEYAADPTVQGLSPGFYRVEVTKDGERIPAKYNTETTLGAEATPVDTRHPLSYDLQY